MSAFVYVVTAADALKYNNPGTCTDGR